jgi:hypothetical protein
MPKAAVFPVPVWACPTRSAPPMTIGIAETCIGVGSSYPIIDIDFSVSLLSEKSSNFIMY